LIQSRIRDDVLKNSGGRPPQRRTWGGP